MKAVVFPGQGSQRRGMGAGLFERYPDLVRAADVVLGYPIADLCLADPRNELNRTEFTQPAVYVVSCLGYRALMEETAAPDFLAGHSVGEYAALEAAGVFDFDVGLRIVRKRAQLMAEMDGGRLAAVIGLSPDAVERLVAGCGIAGIEIANINSPTQVVVGGPDGPLGAFVALCAERGHRAVSLRVSGAFHTSHMAGARDRFREFLDGIAFRPPAIPVIANLTAAPHDPQRFADTLSRHLASPVQWLRSIERLLDAGVRAFEEVGAPPVLTPMIPEIERRHGRKAAGFERAFGCTRPLVVGSLGRGAAGPDLVSALAEGGVLAILDTEEVEPSAIEAALERLADDPRTRGRFGVNVTADPEDPEGEERLVELLLRHGVTCVEARGHAEPSPALLRFCRRDGAPVRRLIVRVQDHDALDAFLRRQDGRPVADAVCVDMHPWRRPGGAEGFAPLELLRDALARRDALRRDGGAAPFVGAADIGGNPHSVRALLAMGGDFVMAGGVFLTAREAALDGVLREALRTAGPDRFRVFPDWRHPAFATASHAYVESEAVATRMRALQRLYLRERLTPDDLRAAMAGQPRFDANPPADSETPGLRAWLRTAADRELRLTSIPCDATPAHFNAWRLSEGMGEEFGALSLADRLCPARHAPETSGPAWEKKTP